MEGVWEGGLFTVFALLHKKTTISMIILFIENLSYILQFTLPLFPLDNMHNVEYSPTCNHMTLLPPLLFYLRDLDNSLIT